MKRSILTGFAVILFVCASCFGYGLLIEPKLLKVRQVEFVSDTYTGPPVRIGLITDIHLGGMHVPPKRVLRITSEMNALKPDFVLLPGDFVDGHLPYEKRSTDFNQMLATGIANLSLFDAPTFATLGNHDAWYGNAQIKELLVEAGVFVLDNAAHPLGDLCLVGLADDETGTPDKTTYTRCPNGKTPIVFTHSPESWPAFRSDTVLALAGHTHGGQVNLPVIGRRVNATSLSAEHSYGFSKLGGVDVFVSAGVGTSILPVRFRSPPEIVVITLTAQ